MLFTAIVLITGAAFVAGPTQLPKAARIFGRFTGRSVQFLFQTKESISQAANSGESEVLKMKKDLDALMGEFYSVRSDIRQGFNIRKLGVPSSSSSVEAPTDNHQFSPTNVSTTTVEVSDGGKVSSSEGMVFTSATPFANEQVFNLGKGDGAKNDVSTSVPQEVPRAHSSNNFAMAFASMSSTSHSSPSSTTVTVNNNTRSSQTPSASVQQPTVSSSVQQDLSQFKNVPIDPKAAPFSSINFSTQAMRGLQEDGFQTVRTENLGGGADLIAKSILERNFAVYAQENNMTEQDILTQWISGKGKK